VHEIATAQKNRAVFFMTTLRSIGISADRCNMGTRAGTAVAASSASRDILTLRRKSAGNDVTASAVILCIAPVIRLLEVTK